MTEFYYQEDTKSSKQLIVKKAKDPIKNWAKDLNRELLVQEIKMTKKYLKNC